MQPRTLALVLAALGLALSAYAAGQDFPNRPLRILVPYTQGGIPDVASRTLAQLMSPTLGQPIVVDNRPGAGGQIALRQLIAAPADGYTIMAGDVAQIVMASLLAPGSFDPDRDIRMLGQTTNNPMYLAANDKLAAKSFAELVTYARANPGRLSYGSAGVGTVHHIFMEALKLATGLNIVHVPFKGSGGTVIAALAGEIPLMISGPTPIVEHVKSGRLRLLVGSTRERSKLAPEVPAAAEFGYQDIDFGGDTGNAVPGATPRAVLDKLAQALAKAAQTPEFERAVAGRAELQYRSADQFAETIRRAIPRYERTIKAAGIKLE